ncbi:hypothetical protein DPMN_094550 [Dreissena polymorpha]|uniref:Uncharacterized protein n=1 Tax=Dreissena polymorpha TaxID=45954 RepID=A0A9D4L5X9_DREPO|nr:hypothetical protein DPMN_094550 [Dreissena polymorpha]
MRAHGSLRCYEEDSSCITSDLRWLTITLAMVGKLGASGAFAVIYVFSAELYPTVLRNSGMGASSCCARVGGMIAPYIADLVRYVDM